LRSLSRLSSQTSAGTLSDPSGHTALRTASHTNGGRVDRVLAGTVREIETSVERDFGIGALQLGGRGAAELGAARLRQRLTGSRDALEILFLVAGVRGAC
jgi:hypothetical protein